MSAGHRHTAPSARPRGGALGWLALLAPVVVLIAVVVDGFWASWIDDPVARQRQLGVTAELGQLTLVPAAVRQGPGSHGGVAARHSPRARPSAEERVPLARERASESVDRR